MMQPFSSRVALVVPGSAWCSRGPGSCVAPVLVSRVSRGVVRFHRAGLSAHQAARQGFFMEQPVSAFIAERRRVEL